MSRIGNSPVIIKEGVEVSFVNNIVRVKGKLGELSQYIDPSISIKIEDGMVLLSRSSELPEYRAKHGLYRALIFNMVEGVCKGFTKKLEFRGVGYRASVQGKSLDISVGYSHNIVFEIPSDIKITAETEKGKAPIVTIFGINKQLVGAIAARIRSERKPEPYKGKGIRYIDEYVRKKAGKTAAS